MWRWGYVLITSWGQGLGSRSAIGQTVSHRMTQQKLLISVTWARVSPAKRLPDARRLTRGAPAITFRDVRATPEGA